MAKQTFREKLLASDDFAHYSLRASFFVRRVRSLRLAEAIQEIHRLSKAPNSFPWKDRAKWGIEPEAWDYLAQKKINPLLIFCHPRVLEEQPRLLLYYRSVALISQKGLATLVGGNIAKIEQGGVEELDRRWSIQVIIALNSVASAVVKIAADIAEEDLPGFQFATAGAQIQGSWNNAIGKEGESAVRSILVKRLQSEIQQVVWKDGTSIDFATDDLKDVLDRIADVRVVRLKKGFHLRFGSEPDISFRNPDDVPVVSAEVKAGVDAAGALERLGAAIKSFENDKNENPRLKTIFVVRSLTRELQNRINQNGFFDHTFSLSELLVDEKKQKTFANLFLRIVLAKKKR